MSFTNDEKIIVFDKIAALYFEKNFGSTTKADFETLLFSEYIEHCMRCGEPYDDYSLSKKLGITQLRIRSLKERKELKYPCSDFDWKDSTAETPGSCASFICSQLYVYAGSLLIIIFLDIFHILFSLSF